MRHPLACLAWLGLALLPLTAVAAAPTYYALPPGLGAHDVAPAPQADGPVYFTAQRSGQLGILDPRSGQVELLGLGEGSAPHGVIVGPDGAVWVTDGGRNALLRVDPATHALRAWPLPPEAAQANLNTAAFDGAGRLWFTGQAGWYGRLDPATGAVHAWPAPRGPGPYGIAATPDGTVYFASLAGNYLARIDAASGAARVIEPSTAHQGARRVWADTQGRLWLSYWNAGMVACYEPAGGRWREWPLPGKAHAYAVWVDERDRVWLSDWSAKALLRFDPADARFESFATDAGGVSVRQLAGRAGELWGADAPHDRLVRLSTR